MNFRVGKILFRSSQSSPPRQGLVGNLLRIEGWKHRLTIFNHTHLGFILRCHQGAVLPFQNLWGQIHQMDHTAAGTRPRCVRVHKHFSYPSHMVGYQRFWATSGTQIPRLCTQIHPGRDGVPEHLLARHNVLVHCQNRAKVKIEEARLWICKSKAQRTKPRQGDPRQPVEAARKEQHHKDEEGYREVVWVP